MRADTKARMELVYAAVLRLPSNGRTVTASVRDLQKETKGLGRNAVHAALKRCVDAGWLEPVGNDRNTHARSAASFRILRQDSTSGSCLWTNLGIGSAAMAVYQAMGEGEEMMTHQVASAAGVSRKTARKHLMRLVDITLVGRQFKDGKPVNGYWTRIPVSDETWARLEQVVVGDKVETFTKKVSTEQAHWAMRTAPPWIKTEGQGKNRWDTLRVS